MPCLPTRCSQQRDDVEDTAIVPILLRFKAFARRQLPTPRERGTWRHTRRRLQGGKRHPRAPSSPARPKPNRIFIRNAAHLPISEVWGSPVHEASHRRHRSNLPLKPRSRGPPHPHCRESAPPQPPSTQTRNRSHLPRRARARTNTTAFTRTRGLPRKGTSFTGPNRDRDWIWI